MRLSDEFIEELKSKADIYDVISSYVSLKKRGNIYTGLCPFHNEKTPSFTVYPDTQSFYCFGCGAGGDPVTFIKKIENLDYLDAVKSLADRVGVSLPTVDYDDSFSKKRKRIYAANREAANFYYKCLFSDIGKVGLDYFTNERKLSLDTIKKFGLGYAPDSWDVLIKYMKTKGFSVNELADAGLVSKSKNNSYIDYFRNRVMTPIVDVRGNVVAFSGRVLDTQGHPQRKYFNTRDTLVYKKSNELFSLNNAKNFNNGIILCEGQMDVIAMYQAGFENSVAGCGTALTKEQVALISRYTDTVYITYDNDEAGRKAVEKAISLFNQTNIKVKIPILSGGKDPDEIIKNVGVNRFKGMIDNAVDVTKYKLEVLKNNKSLNTVSDINEYINSSLVMLSERPPVERELYITDLSEKFNVSKRNLTIQLDEIIRNKERKNRKIENKKIVDDSIKKSRMVDKNGFSQRMIRAEDRLLGLMIKYPDSIKYLKDFDEKYFSSEFYKKLFNEIQRLSNSGISISLMNFSGIFEDEDLNKVGEIFANNNESQNYEQEVIDCSNVIKDEFSNQDKKNLMEDDLFRNLFNGDKE